MLKKLLKSIIIKVTVKLSSTRVGTIIMETILQKAMSKSTKISHNEIELTFSTPNPLTKWRATTFSEKEPETLEWIDNMETGSIIWDIGANVGIYSIYAAKAINATVYAFEPSIFNLELLGRNITNNKVVENVFIVPIALSDKNGFNLMRHTNTDWGGALSSFGAQTDQDGKKFSAINKYKTLGLKPDDLMDQEIFRQPDHIKLDVDGIEHLILAGSQKVLSNVKSILVEINDDFLIQQETAKKLLNESGFKQKKKQKSIFNSKDQNISNQIWTK